MFKKLYITYRAPNLNSIGDGDYGVTFTIGIEHAHLSLSFSKSSFLYIITLSLYIYDNGQSNMYISVTIEKTTVLPIYLSKTQQNLAVCAAVIDDRCIS